MSSLKKKFILTLSFLLIFTFSVSGISFANSDFQDTSNHQVCLIPDGCNTCLVCGKDKSECTEYVDHICVTANGEACCQICHKNLYARGDVIMYWVEFSGYGTKTLPSSNPGIYSEASITAFNKGLELVPWLHCIFSGYAYNDHHFTNSEVVTSNLLGIGGGDKRYKTFTVYNESSNAPSSYYGFNKVHVEYWATSSNTIEIPVHSTVIVNL